MSDKKNNDGEDGEFDDNEPGFRIVLPFGLGWLRGNSHHLEILLPMLRWIIIASTAAYLAIRLVQEMMRFNALLD